MNVETVEAEIKAALGCAVMLRDTIGRGAGGREVALAITKLEEALLWLSKVK